MRYTNRRLPLPLQGTKKKYREKNKNTIYQFTTLYTNIHRVPPKGCHQTHGSRPKFKFLNSQRLANLLQDFIGNFLLFLVVKEF